MASGSQEPEPDGTLPEALLRAIRGYQESRLLLTAIELDVFSAAGAGASAPAIAQAIGADPRGTEMLLNGLAATGWLVKRDGRFANTPATARFLTAGSDGDARDALLQTNPWLNWSHLTEAVRTGTVAARDGDWTDRFIAAMHRVARDAAGHVVGAVGLSGVRRMLDVGGGSGAYATAFAERAPDLRADVLEQAEVAPITERYCREAGVEDRVRVRVGNLRTDHLGAGYDLVLLSAICHMLGEAENRDLLRRCFEACVPGGRVVIRDHILEPDKTSPLSAALFSLTMLVAVPGGATYSQSEYTDWLTEAGFAGVQFVRLPGPMSLMLGARPRVT